MRCLFIPAYLLDRLAEVDSGKAAECGRRTREHDTMLRAQRVSATPADETVRRSVTRDVAWQVHTAHNTTSLPGDLVRSAGQPESGDQAVDEASLGLEASLALLDDFGRSSYDGNGATALATVHYGQDYDNAFWDGTQLVFGDGDGEVFARFTKPIDVLAHELGHAVTQWTANLTYQGQSGALNESISDVFGACVKQRVLGQEASAADWLVGEGIFLPSVNGRSLRSMKDPGTAYDDPRIGRDPQVASMADYVETSDDNGGVHLNSGIPNRAFYLAAVGVGGMTWEGAGRIWFAALTSGLSADCDFATFAAATVEHAGVHADVVRSAWEEVGVLSSGPASVPEGSEPLPERVEGPGPSVSVPEPVEGPGVSTGSTSGERSVPERVEGPGVSTGSTSGERPGASTGSTSEEGSSGLLVVRRTGGFAGIVREGHLELDRDDAAAAQARDLLDRVDFTALPEGRPSPDRYVYDFDCPPRRARVHEPDLTPELAQLAQLVLGEGG